MSEFTRYTIDFATTKFTTVAICLTVVLMMAFVYDICTANAITQCKVVAATTRVYGEEQQLRTVEQIRKLCDR